MHHITIRPNEIGTFDVLINAVSYKIHRGLSEDEASRRAIEIKAAFRAQGNRASIERIAA